MRLSDYIEAYIASHSVSNSHAYRLRLSVRQFEEDVASLSTDSMNDWLRVNPRNWSAKTLHGRRADIMLLWRAAAKRGLCDPPGDVRQVIVPRVMPVAWTVDDVWRLSVDCVDSIGRISMTIGKTNTPHVCRISQRSLQQFHDLAAKLKSSNQSHWKTPLHWPRQTRGLYRWLTRVCESAGVPYGAMQMLRRTGATAIECRTPGAAPRYCGHQSPGLAYRYYVDQSQLPVIEPPSLD